MKDRSSKMKENQMPKARKSLDPAEGVRMAMENYPNQPFLKPNIRNLKNKLESLEKECKDLRDAIAKAEAKAKLPDLTPGQLWKHIGGSVYLFAERRNDPPFFAKVLELKEGGCGNPCLSKEEFANAISEFQYIGMAKDHLSIDGMKISLKGKANA